jgi:uncharacterized membrane protein
VPSIPASGTAVMLIGYQLYRIVLDPAIELVALTLFDVAILS